LSRSSSLSSTPPREIQERSRARRRFRPLRLAVFLLIIAIAALFEPNTFRFCARQAIQCGAWCSGISSQIGGMDGSLLEPLTLRDSVWIYESGAGPITRMEISSATAEFSWRNLLPRSSGPWFQRLTIQGLRGKIQFPQEPEKTTADALPITFQLPRLRGRWLPAPERIEAKGVDFVFQSKADYVRLSDTEFTLSRVSAGMVRAGQVAIKQPWLNRTFRDVRGATAIQETKVEVADLTLEPGVEILALSAELDRLARGQLNLDLRLAAFGGDIRVTAKTLSRQRPFGFEATGKFSQIGVAKLATFLGASEAAGGTIKGGDFNFRGPPQNLARATGRLRLEATNFQWESRQWDALVLGANLMDGRVQVPELALVQGHNRLNLSGEMPLPAPGVAWWQSEFNLIIAAKIENLTELSALMLPEFQFAAGKANIDGSIRGKNQQFNGQLLVSGSDLKWHNAPIDQLHAGVKLNGNELQLTNVSLYNNGDYLRGHGVVNIIGEKQYWGEIHASIEDLATYAALLEKPIVPEPLAGGAVIDWSGEGSAKGHSGRFSARLRKVRSLGTSATLLHPINADLDGNYAPGMIQFSRFALSDDDSSFTANVGVGNKALSLQGIKLYHQKALWLEGDALLPLDVWNAWPNTTLAKLLDDQTVSKINLTAYNLRLREASRLTGWNFPIEGIVLGNLVAEGPLRAIKTSGKLTLSLGQIPLGWSGELLTGVEGEFAFDGQTLLIKELIGRHRFGTFDANGSIGLADLRAPSFQLSMHTEDTRLPICGNKENGSTMRLGGKWEVTGTVAQAKISGSLALSQLDLRIDDLSDWLFSEGRFHRTAQDTAGQSPMLLPILEGNANWIADWELALELKADARERAGGRYLGDNGFHAGLQLLGTFRDPRLIGAVTLEGGPVPCGDQTLWLEHVRFEFRDGFPQDPSILGAAEGTVGNEPFALLVTGTLQHPMRTLFFAPPLTEKLILKELMGVRPADGLFDIRPVDAFEVFVRLLVSAEFWEGVQLTEWPTIPTPALESTPSAPSPTPDPNQ
jgi:hypothetical protein